ncbi:MAG: P-loop NTPase fold protein [Planctomycetota bacterium]
MIRSKTLKYWDFKEHPVADNILRDDLLKLFVNREMELGDAEDALGHSRIVGVYGGLGVGKSSFLQKLKQTLNKDGYPVAYVHLTADSEETLYREMLAEILVLILSKELKLKRITGFKAKDEAVRIVASVSKSRGANFGGKFMDLIGGDLNENKQTQLNAHTEASARVTLKTIFDGLKSPLVVVLDDFEKLRYQSSGKQRDYFPILSRFIGTLEEVFNHKEVSFVVSMDNQVETLIESSKKKKEAFAFSLNSLINLPNLELTHLRDFLKVRLKNQGCKQGTGNFIKPEAFLALALASGTNPRWIVRIVAEAMKLAADRKRPTKQIDLRIMKDACEKAGSPLDAKDWIVVNHILKGGEGSANDDALRKALDFKKPKRADGYHASVERRLKTVATSFRLAFDEVPTGTTKKNVLNIPTIELD